MKHLGHINHHIKIYSNVLGAVYAVRAVHAEYIMLCMLSTSCCACCACCANLVAQAEQVIYLGCASCAS